MPRLMLACLLALLCGCGERGAPLPWAATWSIPPRGGFGEANLAMEPGAQVTAIYQIQGGAAEWNVHGHAPDGAIAVYSSGRDAVGSISFQAPGQGYFSLLWENQTEGTLTASVRLSGDATVVSDIVESALAPPPL